MFKICLKYQYIFDDNENSGNFFDLKVQTLTKLLNHII